MSIIACTTSSFDIKNIENNDGFKFVQNPYKRKLTEKEIAEIIIKYQPTGLIAGVEPITKTVLKKAQKLKVISRCGIGLDNIDLECAKEMGIVVKNTPDAPTVAVAELTVGLIIAVLRNIHLSDRGIRNDEWIRPMGQLLNNKQVGIIGCGRIGSCVAKMLQAFNCKIIGHDKFIDRHDFIVLKTLDEVLNASDIVTIHIPYSSENEYLIGDTQINNMKNGSVLVNTARGGLINEEALYKALKNEKLLGAALDCFEKEPYLGKLKELETVLLTSHIGSYAKEARELQEKQAADNLFFELKKLRLDSV